MPDLPSAVLFACNMNSIRSPMAEGILKFLHGGSIYVDSVGVRKTEINGFCVTVMDEIGIDMSQHNSKSFDDLEDSYFDLVVPMSPGAQHKAVEMTRAMACEVEYWNTFDPSIIESEDRDTMLEAYRTVRDQLMERIKARFPMHRVSDT
ncbi:MAG TPA: low molecular weight phosphatase family protein [Rhodospirillales bacterium]|jgi:protein-tyrosine-phosphatase|nr:MAG: Glutaredoxin arsenate reductase [Alphaproteobacteria bacterium MarineAlpha3_Bin1]PPR71127.1 MAG: Glutaredoxin arsenate reductase [Alphaproteobacteria bacterium MarineAlpha3_Bin2]HIC28919.1 low molecular weight phosphatase family protein [Rhodospirillales bacterium]HIM25754.1 low molecular weight phosphatase family protein [Rhodospirillales bacterium]HIM77401.1 low molecular weight phosphatase family protein [Rhodospirillales bacterium]